MDLVPAKSLAGAYQHTVEDPSKPTNASSWGGLPLKGPDGLYHLFASQFVNNCTLGGWNPGSTVIRATVRLGHKLLRCSIVNFSLGVRVSRRWYS
jgi:hypothetical protein